MLRNKYALPLVSLVTSLFGLVSKLPCSIDTWSATPHALTNLCYSDVGALFFSRGLSDGLIPYLQSSNGMYVEYPVLTGLLMWIASSLAHLLGGNVSYFVAFTWLSSVIFIVATVWVVEKINRRAALWMAISPAIFFTLAINWDALAVLALVVAIWAWQRDKYVVAGIAVAVGTSAKLFPALILIAFALDALKRRQLDIVVRASVATVLSWLVINLPIMIFNFEGWAFFYSFSRERGIDFGSIYLAIAFSDWSGDYWMPTNIANLVSAIAMVAAVVLVYLKRTSLTVAQTTFILLAFFLLFNKVYSPQYWLWLSPMIALSFTSVRTWVLWNVTQVIYFVAVWRYILYSTLGNAAEGAISESPYALTIIVMWLATMTLVVRLLTSSNPQQLEHDPIHL